MDSTVNKYDFNAYDTVIALVLTQYLKERGYKDDLEKVIGNGDVNGEALADLLNRAATWASGSLVTSFEPLQAGLSDVVRATLQDFSGTRYVQSMDVGFCQFLDDFYHDRIK